MASFSLPALPRRPGWKTVAYFTFAAALFCVAAWKRFSIPQDPLAGTDFGYLWPALMKLSGGAFTHMQGLNFLYPGTIYLILRVCGDFRAISVIQHLLGLIGGGLFLASWSRLADFLPGSRVHRIAHEAIGLFGAALYLLSNSPLLLEMRIRSDAVCMFFEILVFWLLIQFFYYQVITRSTRNAITYGSAAAIVAFLLASLKPSFTLTALFVVAPVVWLIVRARSDVTAKFAFFGTVVPVVVALTLTEHFLRRNDSLVKIFLPQTLFVMHAKIIHAQMANDLKRGETDDYPREWLQRACDDLEREIQLTHDLHPSAYPVLGFAPDYLAVGTHSLLARWRRQLGEEQYLRFLKYWYWHSLARRPLAFARKAARQIGVFYSAECPAFAIPELRLAPFEYSRSLGALLHPVSLRMLGMVPSGSDFLRRTERLTFRQLIVPRVNGMRRWDLFFARTYVPILLVTVPLGGCVLFNRNRSAQVRSAAFLVILFYAANFGNVLAISVVHSMEVDRYSMVLFITALFAELWAIRWSTETLWQLAHARLRHARMAGALRSG